MSVSAYELKLFKSKLQAKKRITRAEKIAKELLEANGRDFKFQMILGFYILDFVLMDKMLVVEIDGGYHDSDYQRWYDKMRDAFVTRCEFQVLRLKNEEASTILDRISDYPDVADWEKRFRRGLSLGNAYKGSALQKQRKKLNKPL